MENNRFLVYRATHNLTQQELADKLQIGRELVNRIENGKVKPSKIIEIRMNLLEGK